MRGILKATIIVSAIFCAYWLGQSSRSSSEFSPKLSGSVTSVTGSASQLGQPAANLALVGQTATQPRQITSLPLNTAEPAVIKAPSMMSPEYAPIFDRNATLPPTFALNAYGHRVPVLPPPSEVYDSRPDQIKPRTLENVMANLPPASTEFDRR